MKLIPCALIERWIDPVADGEAGGWRRGLALAHLRGCDRCAAQMNALAALNMHLAVFETPAAPDVRAAVGAAIAREAILPAPRRRVSAWGLTVVGATAAVLVAAGWWVQTRDKQLAETEIALSQPFATAEVYADAQSYEQSGYYDEAAERYRSVYQQTSDPIAGLALARAESARGEFGTALSTYTQVALGPAPWEESEVLEPEGAMK